MVIQSRVRDSLCNPQVLDMSKQNEPKLRNKSLIAMCSLLKLNKNSWGNPTASFLRLIAPSWPEGRQILFDLFSNTDIWIEANFTSTPVYKGGMKLLEIRLNLSIHPDKYNAYLKMIETWPAESPNKIPNDHFLGRHRSDSYKSFCTGEDELDYVNKNLRIFRAITYWFPDK